MIRNPLFAGIWYPKEKQEIAAYLETKAQKTDALACICPHAGWMYSGKVAGAVYSSLYAYDTYVIIGPNHTGLGPLASIFSEGSWKMPLGNAQIDTEFVKTAIKYSEFLSADTTAHVREHCIEVQLPFIQYFNPEAKIVPIILKSDKIDVAKDIANAVSEACKTHNAPNNRILLVASTDMTHYESHEYAKKQDKLALEHIKHLDGAELVNTVQRRGISMCGYLPTAAVMLAGKTLGAKTAKLVKYATSGETSGDFDSVVGYAGLIIK
ncbi:MAG: AmmeMemoRadiSam system protein B [Elusimicrobia bacterium RIFOXYA2_FULL_39_19]|nr:MAG: AmmeMemoRadiSam system protein B [Elusimicrobia bacterium RIFOXYA2_FULL_39_19]